MAVTVAMDVDVAVDVDVGVVGVGVGVGVVGVVGVVVGICMVVVVDMGVGAWGKKNGGEGGEVQVEPSTCHASWFKLQSSTLTRDVEAWRVA